MQVETDHMTCSAVRNASPLHQASPPVTVTWNMVNKTPVYTRFNTDYDWRACGPQVFKSNLATTVFPLLLDDLPDLQEVQEEAEPTVTPVYQVEAGVSHQERHSHTQLPDTHWLTQLAHIATGPQSPLLQESSHSRYCATSPCSEMLM